MGKQEEDEDEEDARERTLPNSAVTVAHGHLLVASHYDFLTKMLDDIAQREQLVDSNEYQLVKAEIDYLSPAARPVPRASRGPTRNIGPSTN